MSLNTVHLRDILKAVTGLHVPSDCNTSGPTGHIYIEDISRTCTIKSVVWILGSLGYHSLLVTSACTQSLNLLASSFFLSCLVSYMVIWTFGPLFLELVS